MAGQSPEAYLTEITRRLIRGWEVDFGTDPDSTIAALGTKRIAVPKAKLMIGLANGWANPMPEHKFLMIWPGALRQYYENLLVMNSQPRGFMFWNIADEGKTVNKTQDAAIVPTAVWMMKELHNIMKGDIPAHYR